ncbi:MAG: cytochrome c nitrite reductase small subunit [Ignavibacteriales bacterium]|nr:cytochrome c nitrite reductase small subunit [Ignavibacteriales bacterium]
MEGACLCTHRSSLTLYVGNATSYLSDDPRACMNCHVMAPQYATWERSSHARVAVCNDCHVPHNNVFNKFLFKAMDGTRHSYMFTFRLEPQVIHIHDAGTAVVQQNCIRCHSHLSQNVKEQLVTLDLRNHGEGKLCWECHRETPHGRVNSLSSVPYARVPIPSDVTPTWMEKYLE